MKTFILINRMVADQGYGRFLSYLLVCKALQCKIDEPSIMIEEFQVVFED